MTDSLIPYSFVPGTKAKASEVNANFIALADAIDASNDSISDLSDLTDTKLAGKLDLNMSNSHTLTNCIVEAPNGVATYSNLTITAKSGLKVLIPDGLNSDGSLKSIKYTLSTDVSTTDLATDSEKIFALSISGSLMIIYKNCYLTGKYSSRPAFLKDTNPYIYYATDTNQMYVTLGSTTANWSSLQACILGNYRILNSTITDFTPYTCLNLANCADKSLSNLDVSAIHNVIIPDNIAMRIPNARKLATIGTRSYYKAYDEDCICGIVTGTDGYSSPMLVSQTQRGASGYDDYDNTPRISGQFEWRGKNWYYMIGYRAQMSTGLKKWANIPLIYKNGTFLELAQYLLETYYSSVSYSMPHKNYVYDTSWFRVWGDGWIEQGGITDAVGSVTISLSKAFSNTNYTVIAMKNGKIDDYLSSVVISNKATTGFTLSSSDARVKNWYACGY
ncbi:hypothetical protein J6S88_06195 [bacterium]|nr:hypothetical protein [bacterium]